MKKQVTFILLAILTVGLFSSCNKINFPECNQLPAKAQQFIQQYFPDNTIISSVKDGSHYDVVLSGNVELEFDLNGDWLEVDCDPNPVPAGIVPTPIVNYVSMLFPSNYIIKVEKVNQKYQIELNNHLQLTFDSEGNLSI